VALGTAYWAQGKPQQAQPLLVRGLLVGNQFDHPLSAWAMIVLGRIALDADRAPEAVTYFEEATITAADYGDARALEEAFGLLWTAQRMTGGKGMAPAIPLAADASRTGPAALRARLLAMQAESLAAAGDGRGAAAALDAIDGRLLKSPAGAGTLGGIAAYAAALVAYGQDTAAGDGEMERALAIARSRSPRLFQTELLVELLREGSSLVSERHPGRDHRSADRRLRHLGGGGGPARPGADAGRRGGDDAPPVDGRAAAGRPTGVSRPVPRRR
jgi:hypothetical protein